MAKNMTHQSAIRKKPELVSFYGIHCFNLDTNFSYTRYIQNAPTRNYYSKMGATRKRLLPQENDYKKQTGSEA